jgi:WD40 repeat protein
MADDVGRVKQAPAQAGRRFAAFISYSHRDEEFGDWLHKRLESYQVPSALVGRDSAVGPVGKRLGKVFRDRADLSAAHDLGREIREGLEQSDALIVLCSPRSCGSKYVQDEIRTFKQLGKGDRIFAAIVDGEPHAAGKPGRTSADECFPPALIYRLAQDGSISAQPEANEPIAADFRDDKDGRENGSLKLIAGLLGVPLDELVQREKQAERGRRLRANAIALCMAALALGALLAFGYAVVQRNIAEENEGKAQQARGEAELYAIERDQAAEVAREREAAAIRSEASAFNAIARLFAERGWDAIDAGSPSSAARYALAGLIIAPDNGAEYRTVLARALFDSGDSTLLRQPGSGPAQGAAVSATGGRALAHYGEQDLIVVWDTHSGRILSRRESIFSRSVFSESGNLVLSLGFGGGVVWRADDGRLVSELRIVGDAGEAAFSPDESVYAVSLQRDGVVRIVNSSNGEISAEVDASGRVRALAIEARLGLLVSGDEAGRVRVWERAPTSGEWRPIAERQLAGLLPRITQVQILDSDNVVVQQHTGISSAWNFRLNEMPNAPRSPTGNVYDALSFASSGLALSAVGPRLELWDLTEHGKLGSWADHENDIASAAISRDGRIGLTAATDGTARLWRFPSSRRLAQLEGLRTAYSSAVRFSADGRFLAGGVEGVVDVRESRDGSTIATLSVGEHASVFGVEFARDRLIVAAGERGELAQYPVILSEFGLATWDLRSRRQLADDVYEPIGANFERNSGGFSRVTVQDGVGQLQTFGVATGRRAAANTRWQEPMRLRTPVLHVRFREGSDHVEIVDNATSRPLATIPAGLFRPAVTFNGDGTRLVVWNPAVDPILWDTRYLAEDLETLRAAACRHLLPLSQQRFTAEQIAADPLLSEIWASRASTDRRVCQ